jgi:hypothetical protein
MEACTLRNLLAASLLLGAVLLSGCTDSATNPPTSGQPHNHPPISEPQTPPATEPQPPQPAVPPTTETKYENERFQGVTVEKVKEDTYRVKGKAQVFEAVFNYVVEDGHNELAEGFVQTSAGAPEWGTFDFTLTAKKAEPNSTLMLILFESSPKDGRRTFELPIPLPQS